MLRPPAVLLRVGCTLPNGLHLKQQRFDDDWVSIENAAPAQLDVAVREAGWHFMWLESSCSRLGCGRTEEAASHRAIRRALAQTEARFNAAELGVVQVTRYLGLRVAKATLHSRHIQQRASLGLIDELSNRQPAPHSPQPFNTPVNAECGVSAGSRHIEAPHAGNARHRD